MAKLPSAPPGPFCLQNLTNVARAIMATLLQKIWLRQAACFKKLTVLLIAFGHQMPRSGKVALVINCKIKRCCSMDCSGVKGRNVEVLLAY